MLWGGGAASFFACLFFYDRTVKFLGTAGLMTPSHYEYTPPHICLITDSCPLRDEGWP